MSSLEETKMYKVEEIYEWIDELSEKVPFSRPKKNFARDFSDGVLVAEILKHFYPRLVDLHNYPTAHSFSLKVDNWNTLNRKVLAKLKLHLTNNIIEELSKANPRAVERLLLELREKIEDSANEEAKQSLDQLNNQSEFSDEIVHMPVTTGADGEKVYKKMVPAMLLEKKITEIKEKDKIIATLKKKVQHLESLLSLKETRIRDLTSQVYKPDRIGSSLQNLKLSTRTEL